MTIKGKASQRAHTSQSVGGNEGWDSFSARRGTPPPTPVQRNLPHLAEAGEVSASLLLGQFAGCKSAREGLPRSQEMGSQILHVQSPSLWNRVSLQAQLGFSQSWVKTVLGHSKNSEALMTPQRCRKTSWQGGWEAGRGLKRNRNMIGTAVGTGSM